MDQWMQNNPISHAPDIVLRDYDKPNSYVLIDIKTLDAAAPSHIATRSVKEGKEGERRHHCRSCSLSVWVASGVEAIQIIDEAFHSHKINTFHARSLRVHGQEQNGVE